MTYELAKIIFTSDDEQVVMYKTATPEGKPAIQFVTQAGDTVVERMMPFESVEDAQVFWDESDETHLADLIAIHAMEAALGLLVEA